MSNKPVLSYTDLVRAVPGYPATLLDGDYLVRTTDVISYDKESGRIETQNSIYLPVDED